MKIKKSWVMLLSCGLLLAGCSDTNNEEEITSEANTTNTPVDSTKVDTTEEEVSEKEGTRSNPYNIGDSVDMKVVYYDDAGETYNGLLNFKINSMVAGEEANEFIMSENEFNEPAPDGYQFVLLDSEAELLEGSEDVQYDLLLTQEIFDKDGQSVTLDDVYATTGNRLSDQSLFPGGKATGYIIPVVPEDIAGTLMKVESLGGGDTIWFDISK